MEKFYFCKANYLEINNIFSNVSWIRKFKNKDLNNSVNIFYEIIDKTIAMHVPKLKVKVGYPIYFQIDTINTIKQKIKAHKKYKSTGSLLHYNEFCGLRSECKNICRICYDLYRKNIEIGICDNV